MTAAWIIILGLVIGACAEQGPQIYPQTTSHTGSTSSSGTVTAKSMYSSTYAPWKAFSDDSGMWISGVYDSPTWIEYSFDRTRKLWAYRLFFANGSLTSRAPKQFDLQVWQSNQWVTVDSRCCETDWYGVEERTFTMSNAVVGDRFRIYFYDDNDSRSGVVVVSLRRIEFLGSVN